MNRTVAIDEILIMHENNIQIWLIGVIDITKKNVGLDITTERKAFYLEKFVKNHIEPGTNVTQDGWVGYPFLDNEDSV